MWAIHIQKDSSLCEQSISLITANFPLFSYLGFRKVFLLNLTEIIQHSLCYLSYWRLLLSLLLKLQRRERLQWWVELKDILLHKNGIPLEESSHLDFTQPSFKSPLMDSGQLTWTAWHSGDNERKPGFFFGSLWFSSLPATPDHTESCPVCGWWQQCWLRLQCIWGLAEYPFF